MRSIPRRRSRSRSRRRRSDRRPPSRSAVPRLTVGLRPHIRQQVGQIGPGGADGQFGQDVRQVRPRVEAMPGRAGTGAEQGRRGLQPAVTADVQPVGTADGQRTDGPLGGSVVDDEPGVIQVPNQGRPLIPGVSDGLAEQTHRRCRTVLHFEPVGELGHDRPRPSPSPIHRVVPKMHRTRPVK